MTTGILPDMTNAGTSTTGVAAIRPSYRTRAAALAVRARGILRLRPDQALDDTDFGATLFAVIQTPAGVVYAEIDETAAVIDLILPKGSSDTLSETFMHGWRSLGAESYARRDGGHTLSFRDCLGDSTGVMLGQVVDRLTGVAGRPVSVVFGFRTFLTQAKRRENFLDADGGRPSHISYASRPDYRYDAGFRGFVEATEVN